jgi:hypothetical protein
MRSGGSVDTAMEGGEYPSGSMEDEERGCSGWSAWGAQHGQRPRAHGHRVAGGDRCGPPRVVGVQLDLPVRRAADVGEAEGGRLPPGIDEDERVVIQQRPPALVQVGCGRPDQVQRDRPGAGPLPVSPPCGPAVRAPSWPGWPATPWRRSSRRPSVASSGSGPPRTCGFRSCVTADCPYGENHVAGTGDLLRPRPCR